MNTKKIVSLQDISCYGQCSLTVALPVLSAFGIETAILPSAILSTHTGGFTGFTVHDLTNEIPAIIHHWDKENIRFDAIYTGYIGDAHQFAMIEDLKKLLKENGKMIVDPAMADHGTMYYGLGDSIISGMRSIISGADLILPNLTEASFLLGIPYKETYTKDEVLDMLTQFNNMGVRDAVLTGVSYQNGFIGAAARNRETGEYNEFFTPLLPQSYHGTGDIFASVAVAEYLNGKPMHAVLKSACTFVCDCINATIGDKDHNYGVKFEAVLAAGRK